MMIDAIKAAMSKYFDCAIAAHPVVKLPLLRTQLYAALAAFLGLLALLCQNTV